MLRRGEGLGETLTPILLCQLLPVSRAVRPCLPNYAALELLADKSPGQPQAPDGPTAGQPGGTW